jgi:hypothetical protein
MRIFCVLLLISCLLGIALGQQGPRVPPGYRLVERVPAEGALANRPPETPQVAARGLNGGNCFWIKFCSGGQRKGRGQQCFWLKFCSSGRSRQ